MRLDAAGFGIGFRLSWRRAMDDAKAAGDKSFRMSAGCSEHSRGGLSFVGFAQQMRAQEAKLRFWMDYFVI